MGRTACTEPQCLYKGDLLLYLFPPTVPVPPPHSLFFKFKSSLLFKRALFLLIIASVVAVLYLMSRAYLAPFVIMASKYVEYSTFCGCFWSIVNCICDGCFYIIIILIFSTLISNQWHLPISSVLPFVPYSTVSFSDPVAQNHLLISVSNYLFSNVCVCMCTVLLPPCGYPISVNKYHVMSYIYIEALHAIPHNRQHPCVAASHAVAITLYAPSQVLSFCFVPT
jgi:hypothetical protein